MEKVSSGTEYRKDRIKDFELPSGHTFRIRKPGKAIINQLMEIMQVQIDPENPPTADDFEVVDVETTAKLLDIVLFSCVVKPKIVTYYTESDDELWLEDVDPIDAIAIVSEVMYWSDLTKEKIDEALFRLQRTSR